MKNLIKNINGKKIDIPFYVVDLESDLSTETFSTFSIVFIISTGKFEILNTNGEWNELKLGSTEEEVISYLIALNSDDEEPGYLEDKLVGKDGIESEVNEEGKLQLSVNLNDTRIYSLETIPYNLLNQSGTMYHNWNNSRNLFGMLINSKGNMTIANNTENIFTFYHNSGTFTNNRLCIYRFLEAGNYERINGEWTTITETKYVRVACSESFSSNSFGRTQAASVAVDDDIYSEGTYYFCIYGTPSNNDWPGVWGLNTTFQLNSEVLPYMNIVSNVTLGSDGLPPEEISSSNVTYSTTLRTWYGKIVSGGDE